MLGVEYTTFYCPACGTLEEEADPTRSPQINAREQFLVHASMKHNITVTLARALLLDPKPAANRPHSGNHAVHV